ncbi:MAG: DUF58 domain-containing protein [Rhizobacter sp.]|nr:DUF58 domain-containing protein [Rhizobacter sp.]
MTSAARPSPANALNPAAAVRRRFRAWWQARLPRTDTLLLTQRNVYILPTRAGLMFCVTLVVLLLASINYQLSLGYVLTFLLAGSGVVSMHLTHNTLRGLTLHLRPPEAVFAGTPALLDVTLTSGGRARYGLGLRMESAHAAALAWTDVPEGGQASTQVSFVPAQRGRHAVPAVHVETRFPLGLFRAWAVWRPAAQVLVYPRLEQPAAPLPPAHATPGGPTARRSADGGEVEGVRGYRRGDPLKLVAWKKAARSLEAGGELVSRDTTASVQQQLWLDWAQCAGLPPEDRLSRLAAWVLAADRAGADHGLRLPGVDIAPAHGEAQRRRCLEALALWAAA